MKPDTSTPPPAEPRPAPPRRRWLGLLGIAVAVLLIAALAAGGWAWSRLRASLPRLEGEVAAAGLDGPVRIERDAAGIPTVRGRDRASVAFGTGFVHAQDRFFQMDLLRRRAAGELAEIFGPAAVEGDADVRRHRLRGVAERALGRSGGSERRLIDAYAAGVNAGLDDLGAAPFEYALLGADPAPWRAEDTLLVVLAMFVDLQDESALYESAASLVHEVLPASLADFLMPASGGWDAPLEGGPLPVPPVPGPEALDLDALPKAASRRPEVPAGPGSGALAVAASNAWAVGAELTATGGALLANDVHLDLAVPNVWYRAALVWPSGAGERRVAGATLPGAPLVVLGTNGDVAWGVTNSWGDWLDLVLVEVDPAVAGRYLTAAGPRPFERATETIAVKGADDVTVEVVSTVWGPLVEPDPRGRPRALRWVAHEPEAVDLGFAAMETARTVEEALDAGHASGMPALNLVVADAEGRVGWSVAGRLPRRVGLDGRRSVSWSDGSRGWRGWLDPAEVPAVVAGAGGRVWTANNRLVDGAALDKLGDGGYFLGARARQIRDRLRELEGAGPEEMWGLQLDDRALFLERWRDLLLEVLDERAVAADPRRGELRRLVESWGGRAAVDSVGFRVVRTFRQVLAEHLFELLSAPCREVDPEFGYEHRIARQFEGPLWRLVSERPRHLLDPDYASWEAMLLDVVDLVIEAATRGGRPLEEFTWGDYNTARIRHPLSASAPALGRWLDMPAEPLPGADDMPRFQLPFAGASQRMVVSPGREDEGFFHMPGGQSGHPLSPHYRDGHAAWAGGEPAPFLPGPPVHVLELRPGPAAGR